MSYRIVCFNITLSSRLITLDSLEIHIGEIRAIELNRDYTAEVHYNIQELHTVQIITEYSTGVSSDN